MTLVRTLLATALMTGFLASCGRFNGKEGNSAKVSGTGRHHTTIISGGGTPSNNHYSQYLQTRLLSADLGSRDSNATIDTHFAAGNNDEEKSNVYDVHRVTKQDGLKISTVLPGIIPGNSPATLANVRGYFGKLAESSRDEPLENLFLVVTDHGMPNFNDEQNSFRNNCIDMWSFDPETRSSDPDQRCLSVNALRDVLQNDVVAERKVFAMTQCYSGGFHRLSVDPDSAYPTADTSICGFTATSWNTTASGCTPDVSHLSYKGYERYFAQRLTGKDVITNKDLGFGQAPSFAAAHKAAAIEDEAKDIPMTTSDFYLIEWAKKLSKYNFKPRTDTLSPTAVRSVFYDATDLDNGGLQALLPSLKNYAADVETRKTYINDTYKLIRKIDKSSAKWSKQTTSQQLKHISAAQKRIDTLDTETEKLMPAYTRIRYEVAYQPWSTAVTANPELIESSVVKAWESQIGADIETTAAGLSGPWSLIKKQAIYRMAVTARANPEEAKQLGIYVASRENEVFKWARKNADATQQVKLEESETMLNKIYANENEVAKLQLRIDLWRRVTYARLEIAAIIALVRMQDSKALAELKGLEECQQTALPQP